MQAKPHVLKSLNQTDFNQFKVPITLFTKTLLNYILVGGEEIYFIYLYIYIYIDSFGNCKARIKVIS